MQIFKLSFLLLCGWLLHGPVFAQDYPQRPIKLVVPFPAGGGVDAVARAVAERLSAELQQPVLVDNRAGAGGALGASVVAKSAGDGYTLLFANNGQAALPHLQKIDWDAVKDFKPVSSVATYAMLILVNGQSPYKTVAELVAAAKAQPGKLAYGSSGPGGPLHLGMEMFKSAAGIDIFHVPYKGNAPMNVALLSGEIPIAMDTLAISLPHIKANKYKALAVTSTKRLSLIPEVPTLAEAGLPGFDYEGWQGIFVPASTPTAVVTQLNAALVKVLAQPALRQRLIDLGYEPKSSSAAEMGATLAKDLNAYRKVITDAKIKVD